MFSRFGSEGSGCLNCSIGYGWYFLRWPGWVSTDNPASSGKKMGIRLNDGETERMPGLVDREMRAAGVVKSARLEVDFDFNRKSMAPPGLRPCDQYGLAGDAGSVGAKSHFLVAVESAFVPSGASHCQ